MSVPSVSRRDLIAGAAGAAALTAVLPGTAAARPGAPAVIEATFLPDPRTLGVASGDPLPERRISRVASSPGTCSTPASTAATRPAATGAGPAATSGRTRSARSPASSRRPGCSTGSAAPPRAGTAVRGNPHIRRTDNQLGYVRTRFTGKARTADLRTVAAVTTPGAPVRTRASFVVPDRWPALVPA